MTEPESATDGDEKEPQPDADADQPEAAAEATTSELEETSDHPPEESLLIAAPQIITSMFVDGDAFDASDGSSDEGEEETIDHPFSPVESELEEELPLPALPLSRGHTSLETISAASDSPAFQCLEELFQQGRITGTQMALLKSRYLLLYECLQRTRDNEFQLLQQSKRYTGELEYQASEMAKADNFPDNITTEAGRMREQLLKGNNTILQTEERYDSLQYTIETLREEKKLLEREYARMPKREDLDARVKALEKSQHDLTVELGKQRVDAKKLVDSLKDLEEQDSQIMSQVDDARQTIDTLKGELIAINSIPGQHAKEAEKLRKQKQEAEKELKELIAESSQLSETLQVLERQKMHLEEESAHIRTNSTKLYESLTIMQAKCDVLKKNAEILKDKEVTLVTDKATEELTVKHLTTERRTLHEQNNRRQRDRDREVRSLRKAQLQLRSSEEGAEVVHEMHAKAKADYDTYPRRDPALLEHRNKLQSEVDQLRRMFGQQGHLSEVEQAKLQQSISEEERLMYELSDLRIEVVELNRLAAIKADEREQKARDFMIAERRYKRAIEDMKSKHLQIQEHKKKYHETQIRLVDFAQLYEVIKAERNKCVNLIQTTTQKASEMREKIRILGNEIEILRTGLANKDRQLQKQRTRHAASVVLRDSLRSERSKQLRIDVEQRVQREQFRLDIQRLNLMVNLAEEAMVQLRKGSDRAIQHRNDRAVQLIERNEEVCILQEKTKVQEGMIRSGEMEMQAREEEIRFLGQQLLEEERSLAVRRKQIPSKRVIESELTVLQIQLSLCQDHIKKLETAAEDPSTGGLRLRLLEGEDLTPVELQAKLEQVEMRLESKEEQLMEKDLLHEAVARLVEQIKCKAMLGRDDTLKLAKGVNRFKAEMNHVTKHMKAIMAELTMRMAESMRLEYEVKDREEQLESCYKRMENGEPPSAQMETEWLRLVESEEVHKRAMQQHQSLQHSDQAGEVQQLPGGGVSMAVSRPNAYIPDENELPIPRPYGAHAPFRPSEHGANRRHIRKPKLKPIEI